ncbi:MAG: NAD(P)/FAD-dependent oxidoreductase [Tepidisphaeraceae bacterium]|jgi:thioredoxin reductase (NADPH)
MSEEPNNNPPVDLAVIGGGPTGLFGAFYAGLRGMSVKIIDSLDILGGQLTTLYPEKLIYDVGGFPQILAKDLAQALSQQAGQYKPAVCLGARVEKLEREGSNGIFTLHTKTTNHRARSILIAAGIGAFEPKTLPLPEAERFAGRGLHYFVKDLQSLRNRRVLIVGGGDSAVDWANTVSPIAASCTLIHRRDGFRAHEQSVELMRRGSTKILTFYELKRIGGDDRIESATIYDNRSKEEQTLGIDALLVNVGFNNSLGPIKEWGLEIEGGSIKVDAMMQTNIPGVFAAGDIATFPGKLKLIATGFGEACIAVNFAKHYLDPKANIFPGHSSNMKR